MTDFKAPPPPPGFNAPASETEPVAPEGQTTQLTDGERVSAEPVAQASQEEIVTQEETPTSQDALLGKLQEQKDKLTAKFNELPSNKKQVVILAGVFVIGLLMGAIMFGGSDEVAAPAPTGLQGVVSNPDIKEPLKRCGQVEASSPCVLYVMNSYTYEKLAEDFFETAVSVTRRKDQVIRMDNVRYTTMRIPPGYFAQIKIPAYK